MLKIIKWVMDGSAEETDNFVMSWAFVTWTGIVGSLGFLFSLDIIPFIWSFWMNHGYSSLFALGIVCTSVWLFILAAIWSSLGFDLIPNKFQFRAGPFAEDKE